MSIQSAKEVLARGIMGLNSQVNNRPTLCRPSDDCRLSTVAKYFLRCIGSTMISFGHNSQCKVYACIPIRVNIFIA